MKEITHHKEANSVPSFNKKILILTVPTLPQFVIKTVLKPQTLPK